MSGTSSCPGKVTGGPGKRQAGQFFCLVSSWSSWCSRCIWSWRVWKLHFTQHSSWTLVYQLLWLGRHGAAAWSTRPLQMLATSKILNYWKMLKLFVCVPQHMGRRQTTCKSPFFYHVFAKDWTEVSRIDSKCFYTLYLLARPPLGLLKNYMYAYNVCIKKLYVCMTCVPWWVIWGPRTHLWSWLFFGSGNRIQGTRLQQ